MLKNKKIIKILIINILFGLGSIAYVDVTIKCYEYFMNQMSNQMSDIVDEVEEDDSQEKESSNLDYSDSQLTHTHHHHIIIR